MEPKYIIEKRRKIRMSEERPGWAFRFLIRALTGMAVIFFVNSFLDTRGIDLSVGLGPLSLFTSGALGLPGVALLYGILVYQSL